MDRRIIRLTAAVVAGSDAATTREILRRFDSETRDEIETAVAVFRDEVNVRTWKKVMDHNVVDSLYQELGIGEADIVNISDSLSYRFSELELSGSGLGEKTLQSIGRISRDLSPLEGVA